MRTVFNQGHPSAPGEQQYKLGNLSSPKTEPDGQAHLETVHLSDDSSDEYQNPDDPEETDSETELDSETLDIAAGAASRGVSCHKQPTIAGRQCEFRPPPDHKR